MKAQDPPARSKRILHVAAAAIQDDRGRVLISRRHDHVHQGGLWEFPGGKLEPGETVLAGLARELREELDIRLLRSEPLIRITHHYPERSVLLDVHRVSAFAGSPRGMEGQPLRWQAPAELQAADFPAADRPIITALRLPDRYLITGADPTRPPAFLERLENALQRGLSLVQLRAHELSDAGYLRLAGAARDLCREYGASLLLNRRGPLPHWTEGVHLNRHQLAVCRQRPRVDGWVGASCHDPQELRLAERLGLDYALLSPVQPTASHTHAAPLGWQRFAEWVGEANLPVYALGGVGLESLDRAKQAGAQGIAAISALWGDQDPPKP